MIDFASENRIQPRINREFQAARHYHFSRDAERIWGASLRNEAPLPLALSSAFVVCGCWANLLRTDRRPKSRKREYNMLDRHDCTLNIGLSRDEEKSLSAVSAETGMTPDEWIKALVRAQLSRKPQWPSTYVDDVKNAVSALNQIGALVHSDPNGRTIACAAYEPTAVALSLRLNTTDKAVREYWGVSEPVCEAYLPE